MKSLSQITKNTLSLYKDVENKLVSISSQVSRHYSTDSNDNQKNAVISGKSVTGMMSALTLAQKGYNVDIYDIRSQYSRNIQWAGRQSLIDSLSLIDPDLSEKFIQEGYAMPLDNGSVHLGSNGSRKVSHRQNIKTGDSNRIPKNGVDMIAEKSVITMEAKRFELMLKEYLDKIPNIKQHKGSVTILDQDSKGNYKVLNHGTPNLIIIAEGANSSTRKKLGIQSVPTSNTKLQIAGVIQVDSGGKMVKHWRLEDGQIRLTGTIGTKMSNKSWIVADVDPEKITPAKKYTFDHKIMQEETQELIRKEFKRLATQALELPGNIIENAHIEGAIGGGEISAFGMQQKISETAFKGNNVILLGDAVGNNHWSVGGGMQIGAICHNQRLRELIASYKEIDPSDIENKKNNLEQYSKGVIEDSMAWGRVAMADCYPELSKYYARILYDQSIEEWKDGKADTPLEAIDRKINSNNNIKLSDINYLNIPSSSTKKTALKQLQNLNNENEHGPAK